MVIVRCRDCKREEYEDYMVWYNGHTYCRRCTYDRWEQQSNWKRGESDFVFPLDEKGVDQRAPSME